MTTTKAPAEKDKEFVEYTPFGCHDPIKLSAKLVMRYLCKPTKLGKLCTEEQAVRFIMLCMTRKLNPFDGDAFIIGYDTKDGPEFNLVTAHQAFLKRAEAHLQYDGMESGVLIQRGSEIVELQGDFYNGDDILVGAWAKVFRKDRPRPTYRRVKLGCFQKSYGVWQANPGTMIVKVAEADALRSTFPNNLAGLYIDGEMPAGQEIGREEPPKKRGVPFRPAIENGHAPNRVDLHELREEPEPVPVTPDESEETGPFESELFEAPARHEATK